jgi:hypothetical protein
MTQEERLDRQTKIFTDHYSRANPPPAKGSVPIALDTIVCNDGNRYPCVGGPFDGQGIAQIIELKKGAGKKKLFIRFPPGPEISISSDEGESGTYIYVDGSYLWNSTNVPPVALDDPWLDPGYWKHYKQREQELYKDAP